MSGYCSGYEAPVGRRQFLNSFGMGLGGVALADLMAREARAEQRPGVLESEHHTPRAKRVIFLFQAGAPSQIDTLDHKPLLNKRHGEELPASIRMGQRLTAMSGNQSSLPMVGSPFKFSQHGESGTWMSDLLPHTAKVADDICVVKSMYTEAINHGPGVTFLQTGSQFPGRPSMGAWLSYGLGTESSNLPAFVVMVTRGKGGQPLVSRLWGSGFLPSENQGVRLRADKDAVLYLQNPEGVSRASRQGMLKSLETLHRMKLEKHEDAHLESRIAQYELAYQMQMSIPEATDLTTESATVLKEYGDDAAKPGTFAANCVLARRLAERGVRFIQLYHQGWDQHGNLPNGIKNQCRETDRASAALIKDLKQRGLLEDTLVVWGGEFGRTNYCQGKLSTNFGRDHHPRCFSIWMAGGGIQGGMSYGETDALGYNVADQGVHVHDLQATILNQLGIDHERLTYKYQGRYFRLTDVHGHVVEDILA